MFWIFGAMSAVWIYRAWHDLNAPPETLPRNASRGAAWTLLGLGVFLFFGSLFWSLAAWSESQQPHGEYGTIGGIPISRADFNACGGKIPAGCPGGGNVIFHKYEQLRRARG